MVGWDESMSTGRNEGEVMLMMLRMVMRPWAMDGTCRFDDWRGTDDAGGDDGGWEVMDT